MAWRSSTRPKPVAADAELILVLSDWRLDAAAQIVPDFDNPADALREGRFGGVASVNSSARTGPLAYPPARGCGCGWSTPPMRESCCSPSTADSLKVIAVDGQPCDPFEPVRRTIPAAPGARFDVILDLPPLENQKTRLILRGANELPDATLLEFLTKGAPRPPQPILPATRAQSAAAGRNPARSGQKARPGHRRRLCTGARPPPIKPEAEDFRRIWRSTAIRASTGRRCFR